MVDIEQKNNTSFVYFGSSDFSVYVLDELEKEKLIPKLIVTTEDKPKGRNLILSPSPVKTWSLSHNIDFIETKTVKNQEFLDELKSRGDFDLYIVASFGKIIPDNILSLPKYKTLNVHPSLLPKLRGASPIQSSILEENETGVTVIRLDEEIDHGPILAQEKLEINWPPDVNELEKATAKLGAKLLAKIIPKWINGEISEIEQEHNLATFTKKIEKKDGELNLSDSPDVNLRKVKAFINWPNSYFFKEIGGEKKRIIVKSAHIEDGKFIIDRVLPEGKKEMDYSDFLRGIKNS